MRFQPGWLAGITWKSTVKGVALAAGLLGAPCVAHAWEFRCRFVERVGNVDVELPFGQIDIFQSHPRNIRVQFGVFDDANGAAPAGGFLGWNFGTLTVSGSPNNSDERRNNGRIAPFNFAQGVFSNGNPALPGGDPFDRLTEIDATLGVQSPVWVCSPLPDPLVPEPVIRGLNTFVSVYAFQVDPSAIGVSYEVALTGSVRAATGWNVIGTPVYPDCGDPADPSDDVAGSITYVPVPLPGSEIAATLRVIVPAPGAGLLVIGAAMGVGRRRR